MFKKFKRSNLILSFLVMIGLGVISSYAYFVKYINVDNDLKFRTGSLIVNLGDGTNEATKSIKIENIQPGTYGNDMFKIKNNGTLNAKIKLTFNVNEPKDKELLSKLTCNLVPSKGNEEKYKSISNTFDKLIENNNGFEFTNDNAVMILRPNEEVNCNFTVYLDDTVDFKYENSKVNFSVTVKAIQV